MADRTQTPKADRQSSKHIKSLAALWPFVARYKVMLCAALGSLVFTAMISLILPLVARRVIDSFSAENAAFLDQYFFATFGVVILLALGTALRYYLVTRLGEKVIADIRVAVFSRMIGMGPQFFERILTGEVISRITTDTTLILSVVGSSASVALRNILIFIGAISLMLWTSFKMTLLVLWPIPVVLLPIVILGRKLRSLGRENQDLIAMSSGEASEQLLAAQTIQSFTHEDISRARFSAVTGQSLDSALRRILTRAIMTAIVIFIAFSSVVAFLWIGADGVRSGTLSVGALVQFIIYTLMVAGSLGALSEIWGELQRAAGATERLVELLEAKDAVVEAESAVAAPDASLCEIRFQDVDFSYPSRPNVSALKGFNLTIAPGESVALVGPSGAGKSTVFHLLQRFYDPQAGGVFFGERNICDVTRQSLREQMALVPQESAIFAASAGENIRLGRAGAGNTQIEQAAKAANAHEFLSALPGGYATQVGERGVMLSGGQKQRIAIARAILRDAPVLLLDEATSALDAQSERAVQVAVERLAKTRTTIMIAHRLATVKQADRIVVLDQGQIVAQGTHDELVAQGGLYARLAKLQFT